ncbi:MAG: hypothetical protein IKJ87_05970 [Ruminococcus sp.]|nr:hypothetical protein [Ruminococcus sp.]
MIVLKILLWIILALLGIILLILVLPVSVQGSFIGGKVGYSVKFAFIPVFDSKGKGIVNKLLKWRKKKSAAKKDEPHEETPAVESSEDANTEEITAETAESIVSEISQQADTYMTADEPTETVEAEAVEISGDTVESEPAKDKEKPEKEKQSKLEFILGLWEAADRPILRIFKGIKLSEFYIDFFIANEDAYKCALNYGRISGALYNIIAWLSVLFNVKLKTVDINPLFGQKKSQWDISLKISLCLMTMLITGIQFLIIYIFRVFIPSKRQLRKARL